LFILRKRILENENGNSEHHIILGVFETKEIAVEILKKHGNEKIEIMNNEYTYVIRDEEGEVTVVIELEEVEINKMIEILL
jgi:hypothetical protein